MNHKDIRRWALLALMLTLLIALVLLWHAPQLLWIFLLCALLWNAVTLPPHPRPQRSAHARLQQRPAHRYPGQRRRRDEHPAK